jgi:dCMP deaminase
MSKPSWDQYFLDMLEPLARRSSCLRRKVSALIVLDNRIIASGYNGTPRGAKDCDDGGCARCASIITVGEALEVCVCSHAEENAIVQCAYLGVSCDGATLYTTWLPCLTCAKMIINAGIKLVVWMELYHNKQEIILDLFKQGDVSSIRIGDYRGRTDEAEEHRGS